jgi:hypothetical protein
MIRLSSSVASAAVCLAVLSPAGAQGSDSCTTPTVLGAVASFPFDNAAATQGGEAQTDPLCQVFGTSNIGHDVWFTWTAPTTGTYTLSTCGGTSVDTKIAAWSGGTCPTNLMLALACNDDGCGQQSTITFQATAGNAYVFQIGTDPNQPGGTGTVTIAAGGQTCQASTGPDVIVGNMQDIANHTNQGPLDAITLGTTSCNIGTQPLNWVSSTNLHPVIGATLYRHRVVNGAGRFEQIGMSWLKHGFIAEAGSLCCTCLGTGGAALAPGCSDPYNSSLNGSQPVLGPRWEVNAHTGVFAMPHANPPWSGNTARRLEFAASDVDTTAGVRYVGECTYVTQDDAAAGNQNNNSSWRQLSAAGGPTNFSFAFAGPIRRTQQGIRAWAEFEPGVTLTDVQVPGDGHFVVGSKATDLGGGMWHYEYAVHNQNADRNCGSFTIAIPPGAMITNAEFHDVAYRNGDGPGNVDVTGTDWAQSIGGGVISWSCDPASVDPAANAIRWSSTYSFRFDADVGPAVGNAVLGLWKPGTPGAMNATAQVPMGSSVQVSVFCAGDGSASPCPCGNAALAGSGTGCRNSIGNGALLGSSGTPSITSDTFALEGSGMPNASALYFQGTNAVSAGTGAPFGDGLRCAGGTVTRLGTQQNVMGMSTYPAAGDPLISVEGADAPGDVRFYQCWYRNAASYCTSHTFNLTNGIRLAWLP